MVAQTFEELHREMWNWLADNPSSQKRGWPRWVYNGGDIEPAVNCCFACCETLVGGEIHCNSCPIDWGVGSTCVVPGKNSVVDTLYLIWDESTDPEQRFKLAKQIANLAWTDRSAQDTKTN